MPDRSLDGKCLLRCSGPRLSAENIALGYKQLPAKLKIPHPKKIIEANPASP